MFKLNFKLYKLNKILCDFIKFQRTLRIGNTKSDPNLKKLDKIRSKLNNLDILKLSLNDLKSNLNFGLNLRKFENSHLLSSDSTKFCVKI